MREYLERTLHPFSRLISGWFGGKELRHYFLKFRRDQKVRGIKCIYCIYSIVGFAKIFTMKYKWSLINIVVNYDQCID